MATLSTLELMLHEIQNQENIGDHGRMPVLPQRPVSKARIPSRRTRRAILSFHLQEFGGKKKDEFVDVKSKRDGYAFVDGGLVLSKNNEDEKEKGILQIQKCFRGYQARFHYYKLKEGIITLQSFVRGENARREFQKWTKMPIQEFMWKPLRNRETTIIYLQSVVRDWLNRRHPNYIQNATTTKNTDDANDLHNENTEIEDEFVDVKSKRDGYAFVDGGLVLSKNNEDEKEKGILQIQKCFRGYQARFHYYKLKEGIITLQSFVRGENARREFQKWTKMPIQEFMWKPLRNRETTIIYLQSVVRDWLNRRHPNYIQNATTTKNTDDANDLHNENTEIEEHVMVAEPYIRDLQRQVLRTEAALRHKIQENSLLALQIQEIDTKWELHKAEMNSKEKTWQDEFTSIQMSLASTRERTTNEIFCFPQNPSRRHNNDKTDLTIRQILEMKESDSSFHIHGIQNSQKCHKQELSKLKGRFKAWKKEFKTRLQDIKKTIDRIDDDRRTKRVHKSCWVA